jgi:hypothetical protein
VTLENDFATSGGASSSAAKIYHSGMHAISTAAMEAPEVGPASKRGVVLHAMPTPRIKGRFTACNVAARPGTWRAFRFARHNYAPYLPPEAPSTLEPAGIGPNRPSLE